MAHGKFHCYDGGSIWFEECDAEMQELLSKCQNILLQNSRKGGTTVSGRKEAAALFRKSAVFHWEWANWEGQSDSYVPEPFHVETDSEVIKVPLDARGVSISIDLHESKLFFKYSVEFKLKLVSGFNEDRVRLWLETNDISLCGSIYGLAIDESDGQVVEFLGVT